MIHSWHEALFYTMCIPSNDNNYEQCCLLQEINVFTTKMKSENICLNKHPVIHAPTIISTNAYIGYTPMDIVKIPLIAKNRLVVQSNSSRCSGKLSITCFSLYLLINSLGPIADISVMRLSAS